MKFRILDLFLTMTFAALVFAAFKHDLVAFRQLVLFALISIGAVVISLIAIMRNHPIIGGAVGGTVGGAMYLAMAFLMRYQFYDEILFSPNGPDDLFMQWLEESMWVFFLAAGVGAAMGPLLTSHLKNLKLPPMASRDRLISWALFGGVVLLLFFKMKDRVSMIYGGRDWSVIIALLILGFIGHTILWNRKLRIPENGETQPNDDR